MSWWPIAVFGGVAGYGLALLSLAALARILAWKKPMSTRTDYSNQLLALSKDVRDGRDMEEVYEELEVLLDTDVEDEEEES